jgi:hypothetical protein
MTPSVTQSFSRDTGASFPAGVVAPPVTTSALKKNHRGGKIFSTAGCNSKQIPHSAKGIGLRDDRDAG